jgi:hypothetical protein
LWFLGLWLLVLSHLGSNWGFDLDFGNLKLSLWDPGPGGLLDTSFIGSGSHGFGGSYFGSS